MISSSIGNRELNKSPERREECEARSNKNLTELNPNLWKLKKTNSGTDSNSPDYYNNKGKPVIRNELPPVILKTAQWFYKNNSSSNDSVNTVYVQIEKPKNPRIKIADKSEVKRGSSTHLHENTSEEKYDVSKILNSYRWWKKLTTETRHK